MGSERETDDQAMISSVDDEFLETLLDGLDFCLKTFVGNDNLVTSTHKKTEEPNLFMSILTFGYNSTPKDENFFKKHEDVGRSILGDLRKQLDAFITCWEMDKDFLNCVDFTDYGCLGYSVEKLKKYIAKVDFSSYPNINQKIVKIIRPFGKRFMKTLVEELVKYWINSFDKPSAEENRRSTKTLQTIVKSFYLAQYYL